MKYVGNVQSQANSEVYATASGTLPNGKPVVVNSDGSVSVVSGTDAGFGSKTNISGTDGNANIYKIAFDSGSNKIVFGYRDGSNYAAAVVGTVSGTSISFGTPAVMESVAPAYMNAIYDSNANKTVFFYRGSGGAGTAVVGTVSGTNISFGSKVTVASNVTWATGAFDSNSNKVVLSYRDSGNSNYGTSRVGTISGTGISFGTARVFLSASTQNLDSTFDSNSNKIVVAYRNSSSVGTAIVGTVSGTNINFGSSAVFNNANSTYVRCAFDSNSNKVVIVYRDGGNSSNGTAVVATVSGTSISFGSEVVYEDGTNTSSFQWTSLSFDSSDNTMIVAYGDNTDSSYGKIRIGTVSGTSISFSASTTYNTAESRMNAGVYDSNANKTVIAFSDYGNSQNITGIVYGTASTNLTTENFVGITNGVVEFDEGAAAVGSAVAFESAATNQIGSTFDSNSNKVVVLYRDAGNSNTGTAAIGTVSGTSITFGTPVVFRLPVFGGYGAAYNTAVFDSNSNKVVIVYGDYGNGGRGAARVGTVSGTTISFGTEVIYEAGASSYNSIAFDSNSNKVVVAYKDGGDSGKGKAIVGTVSGTDISFGTAAVYETGDVTYVSCVYDENAQKFLIAYRDTNNSSYATAVVGTVSGTDISFGTAVVIESASSYPYSPDGFAYDPIAQKSVLGYISGSNVSKVIVATISGTNVSFGTAVTFANSNTGALVYDTTAKSIVMVYRDIDNSNHGTYKTGTVSGTSITVSTATAFDTAAVGYMSAVYDSNSNKVVPLFENSSGYGAGVVVQVPYDNTVRGSTASGSTAIIQAGGAVNTLQTGLTPGQQYFVQTDGTLGLTADDPSVIAGTAVSATDLIVKG